MTDFVLAAIQAAPVHFDRDASTEKACRLIAEAGAKGATVAAFGETWLPGYPTFAFAPPTEVRWRAGGAYIAAALDIPGPQIARVCAAARKAKIDVVIGVAELDHQPTARRMSHDTPVGWEGRSRHRWRLRNRQSDRTRVRKRRCKGHGG